MYYVAKKRTFLSGPKQKIPNRQDGPSLPSGVANQNTCRLLNIVLLLIKSIPSLPLWGCHQNLDQIRLDQALYLTICQTVILALNIL